ncbi:MAG: sugar O-acetyltransferase [Eubacteriales bacterium]|jgi:acetyltransferase-like isoleucine patch superfamily enzyme
MTEWEKARQGQWINAADEDLWQRRQRAKMLLWEAERLRPDQVEERMELYRQLLGGMGNDCYIEPPFRADYGTNITLGDGVYINYNLTVLDCAPVTVGNRVLIAPNVSIYNVEHPFDPVLRGTTAVERGKSVVIEDDVWIGGSVTILGGVTIGRGSIIGAGSVVNRDIPPGVVAAGNPCRPIRPIDPADRVHNPIV